jgi:Family of unknown function (DUF6510)
MAMDSAGAEYDGNTLAGPLAEVFSLEVTAAIARCDGCGRSGAVAELAVYGPGPGLVGRCPGCSDVLLRVARTPDSVWLDLRGMTSLQIPLTHDSTPET